ncbi:MAG: hypothetical protein J2O49_04680 [Sciscionella sp.]|nr:hypothetical protein [Sciscionella sp.]
MANEGKLTIHSAGDARNLTHRYRYHNLVGEYAIGRGHHHGHTHSIKVTRASALSASGNGLQVDLVELLGSTKQVTTLADQLHGMINKATDILYTTLPNGSGPVATAMRHAFRTRADETSGVLGSLQRYQENMNALLQAMLDTAQHYAEREDDIVASLRSAKDSDSAATATDTTDKTTCCAPRSGITPRSAITPPSEPVRVPKVLANRPSHTANTEAPHKPHPASSAKPSANQRHGQRHASHTVAASHRHADDLTGIRWENYSHEQLYDMVMTGEPSRMSQYAESYWLGLAKQIQQHSADVHTAMRKLLTTWSGPAAEQSATSVNALTDWADKVAIASNNVYVQLTHHAWALDNARKDMPVPVPYNAMQSLKHGTVQVNLNDPSGAAELRSLATDMHVTRTASTQAKSKAVQVMRQYASASHGVRQWLPNFPAAPAPINTTSVAAASVAVNPTMTPALNASAPNASATDSGVTSVASMPAPIGTASTDSTATPSGMPSTGFSGSADDFADTSSSRGAATGSGLGGGFSGDTGNGHGAGLGIGTGYGASVSDGRSSGVRVPGLGETSLIGGTQEAMSPVTAGSAAGAAEPGGGAYGMCPPFFGTPAGGDGNHSNRYDKGADFFDDIPLGSPPVLGG